MFKIPYRTEHRVYKWLLGEEAIAQEINDKHCALL